MGIGEHIKRTSVATISAGIVFVGAFIYGFLTRDTSLVKELALIAAGFLFGITLPRLQSNER